MSPTEFMQEYESAANRHDLEAMLDMIADDAIFWFSDGSVHIGKDAIARAIQSNFDAIKNEDYRITDLSWLTSSDDIAACVYEFHWSGEVAGKPASGGGRGTSLLKPINGQWRLAHEHLSPGKTRT